MKNEKLVFTLFFGESTTAVCLIVCLVGVIVAHSHSSSRLVLDAK
jgi:hypothetical protein